MTNLKLLDTKSVAAIYNISLGRVQQIAKQRKITPLMIGGIHLWSVSQVGLMKPKAVGRPRRKVKGK